MKNDPLNLQNQLCFPAYAASRLITREYQPYLDALGITYPQYLVMMVLWERDGISVNDIAGRLILNTNTVTPLLKRMEQQGLLERQRSEQDERVVIIRLTEGGKSLREKALEIPKALSSKILRGPFNQEELIELKNSLEKLIVYLSEDSH